jgi:uncharacterized lipoprotein YajG
MNFKLPSLLTLVVATVGLTGCAAHHPKGISTDQATNWDNAATQYKACKKDRWVLVVADAPQWNQLVSGYDDPQYFEKLTSSEPLTKALKDSLIKYRPQQMACRKALFESLGANNLAVKMMYQKNFNELDNGIVKIIDGKLRTMGELNQAYVAYNNQVAERKAYLILLDK